MEEENKGELAFLDTLLKSNNGKISLLLYKKPKDTDQYPHYRSHHQTSYKEIVVSSLFVRAYSQSILFLNYNISMVWLFCCLLSLIPTVGYRDIIAMVSFIRSS